MNGIAALSRQEYRSPHGLEFHEVNKPVFMYDDLPRTSGTSSSGRRSYRELGALLAALSQFA